MKSLLKAGALGLLLLGAVAGAEKKPASGVRVGITKRVFHPTNLMRNWRGDPEKDLRVTVWYPAANTAVEVQQEIGPPGAALFEAGMAAPDAALAPGASGSKGKGWPLVLLSHGTGGSAMQMAWLGTALAQAGFVAVAVDHPGNNSNGKLTAEGFTLWWERATDLSQVLDGMLADPEFGKRIDQDRVGAAGFSLGGYTVLELAGAQTDISELYVGCRKNADRAGCVVPEMRGLPGDLKTPDDFLHAVRKTSGESLARSGELFSDDRIGAVFAIAPALGFTLTDESLREIRTPVEMVVGDDDRIAPAKENAGYVHSEVRGAKLTVLPHVQHYTFLDVCTAEGKAKLGAYCEDHAEVDREAVHEKVAGMAVAFFAKELKVK
jgi:predicted dienelactone hydrolase